MQGVLCWGFPGVFCSFRGVISYLLLSTHLCCPLTGMGSSFLPGSHLAGVERWYSMAMAVVSQQRPVAALQGWWRTTAGLERGVAAAGARSAVPTSARTRDCGPSICHRCRRDSPLFLWL